jgi:malate permease and related proteins
MAQFALILFCLLAGHLMRRFEILHKGAPQTLNTFIIYLSLPALVLLQIPEFLAREALSGAMLIPVSMAWLQFALAFAVVYSLAGRMGFSRATTGALILTAGLGNTSFVGFPLLEALLGSEALRIGIIVDQAGSFLVVSTLGVLTASLFSEKKARLRDIALKILRFPPFLALVLALVSSFVLPGLLSPWRPALGALSSTLVPLALVSVGYQIHVSGHVLSRRALPLGLGLGLKLFVVPAVLALLYMGVIGQRGEVVQVTVLEAAMAPMITAAIVAADFHLDTEIANLMVGVGIPVSLLTVTIWNWILF